MFQTVDECRRAWEEKGRHGTTEERLARGELWDDYYAYLAKGRMNAPPELSVLSLEVADYLCKESILGPEKTVLDIGSGMGDHALAFASQCGHVTALDRSSVCLDVLRHRTEQMGIGNITIQDEPWEIFQPQEKYDVTFSSMCPAICSYEELLRMESMTRETCCLVTVMRGSVDRHRREMMKRLQIVPKGGMATEALQYYEILYLMGRMPEVKCWSSLHTSQISLEAFLERYQVYFRIFNVDETASEPFLRDYFAENARDGILTEESQMNLALITWHPAGVDH